MARSDRDYFKHSHFAHLDDKIRALRDEAGNDGYACFFLLLELCSQLYTTPQQQDYKVCFSSIKKILDKRSDSALSMLILMKKVGLINILNAELKCGLVTTQWEHSDHLVVSKFQLSIPKLAEYKSSNVPTRRKEGKKERSKKEEEGKKKKSEAKASPPTQDFMLIVKTWNETVTRLPKVINCSKKREEQCRRLYTEHPDIEYWQGLFARANQSEFLTGNSNRGWRANFDWVLKSDNRHKILEGNYDNVQGQLSEEELEYKMLEECLEQNFKHLAIPADK